MLTQRIVVLAVSATAVLSLAQAGLADSRFYRPYGATASGYAPYSGAGYTYVAPSYRIGWVPTTYRTYADYHPIRRSPASLFAIRPPVLSYIPPYFQSAYSDYGVPSLGYPSAPTLAAPPVSLGFVDSGYGAHLYGWGATYHPYVTASQYVYRPTYPYTGGGAYGGPYGAVYGAYGYSMFYGY